MPRLKIGIMEHLLEGFPLRQVGGILQRDIRREFDDSLCAPAPYIRGCLEDFPLDLQDRVLMLLDFPQEHTCSIKIVSCLGEEIADIIPDGFQVADKRLDALSGYHHIEMARLSFGFRAGG